MVSGDIIRFGMESKLSEPMDDTTRFLERDARLLLLEKYHGVQTADFRSDLERLAKGEPLAYIIGNVPFLGCIIDLSYKPLIPRTETEFWVERALQYIREKNTEGDRIHILDIFSGSGCIGIALAKHIPNVQVDFAEIDPKLVVQIELNIKNNAIENNRVHVFVSDLFATVPQKKYSYIFANPPYISKEHIDAVQPSVIEHEPHHALFADDDGAYFIKKLIAEGREYLAETGTMFIEMDPHQKDAIIEHAKKFSCNVSFWEDQFKNTRVVAVRPLRF